jgi:hypothetical protein
MVGFNEAEARAPRMLICSAVATSRALLLQ